LGAIRGLRGFWIELGTAQEVNVEVSSSVTEQDIKTLASLRFDDAVVLSLYLDLNPSDFPTRKDVSEQAESLLDRACRRLKESGLDKKIVKAGLADAAALRSFVDLEMSREGALSAVGFVCSSRGLARVFMLARPLRARARFDSSPYVRPLSSLLTEYSRFGVIVCNRQTGRLLRFHLGRQLGEEVDIYDSVHGKHDQGGWSQARYGRHIETEAARHFKHVAGAAAEYFAANEIDHLVLVGPREDTGELFKHLDSSLQKRVVRSLHLAADTPVSELLEAVDAVDAEIEAESDRQLVSQLRELEGSGKAVVGLQECLDSLVDRKVAVLLVARGFVHPGWRCPSCSALATVGPRCPRCGNEKMARVDDVVEEAIQLAWASGARVELVSNDADLDVAGRIGAILRY
jgi:peptide chain release factor subunit 1